MGAIGFWEGPGLWLDEKSILLATVLHEYPFGKLGTAVGSLQECFLISIKKNIYTTG